MLTTSTPVAIIGCGPAGTGASLFLSKAGIPHVLLEKDIFPRDKICGDGCSGKTLFVLRKADPAIAGEVFADDTRFLPSYGIVFAAPNGKTIDIPFSPTALPGTPPPGFTARRTDLDHFLFRKIQGPLTTVLEGVAVSRIDRTAEGFRIGFRQNGEEAEQELNCRLLIGADGDKGISKRKLLQQDLPAKTAAVGLRTYYKGVTGLHTHNFIELHFLPEVLPGYFWIFPLPGGYANVGICMESSLVRRKKVNLKAVMQKAIQENPALKERFAHAEATDKLYGWGLPMGSERTTVSGAHFMLTGDAASLIDPFTGEGIGNALFSGMLAAEAAVKALAANRCDAAFLREQYDDVLFRRLGDELKLSYTMQRLTRFPWLFNLVVNKARKSESLRRTLTSMFADLDMRALLRSPSFYWKILTNR